MDGCIIGRALYEGRVSLKDALEAADPQGDEVGK
jgi:phosphoribosylformimino-5-aminoimidazole carboxamide ribonucleotide (ProFAR) isomerase